MGKSGNVYAVSPRRSLQQELDISADEERRGLLSNEERSYDDDVAYSHQSSSRKLVVGIGIGFIVILLGALVGRPLLRIINPHPKPKPDFDHTLLRSNGTHYFKKSALIVSIDGLRADYLDRGLTPHLLAISKKGLRAKAMKSVFPTLTFPNHWALMTGLYAESHGIVANNFWDPATDTEFHYNDASTSWPSHWWLGEPMWETAQRAGIITANLMWPGPPTTASGSSPTYYVPWRDRVPLKEKLDQITTWIDLPIEERPQLIMAYEPSLDQAGHLAGPASDLVNVVLHQVDAFAKDLHDALEARNLTEIFDVVFVSDHGMTDTSDPEWIHVDDILGDGFSMIEHDDGWPSMGLRFKPEADTDKYLRVLLNASEASGGKFHVYTHETMPERWHFADNYRIAPIYIVPKMGYALTNHVENGSGMSKGNHGYDNDEPAMYAMFVAHGPFSAVVKAIEHDRRQARVLPRFLSRPNKGWHSTADDTYVMDTFENVNVYNLMIKLLGIESFAAPNNGTQEFWDEFF
ncbi:nucleotide pyrophosphatase [Daedalea quercina L-15889]|uniref:Nucleotide pyrophosphatase n=1 Tax=Daedalea quercina L-15889 TaxID=1314783 RepID=A0A165NQM5_9APHY|nr:nucleotide pyrophosphatase [Daedalea quercina L-15889]